MRSRRGFNLMEMVVVITLALILATVGTYQYRTTLGAAQQAGPKQRLLALVTSQHDVHATRGRFTADLSELTRLEENLSYVPGTSESSGDTVVSVAVDTVTVNGATVDMLGLAVLVPGDGCLMVKVAQPTADVDDVRVFLRPPRMFECSGEDALTVAASDGYPW